MNHEAKTSSGLREDRGVDGGLDDPGVHGQDGEDDAGQEEQRQLVDVLDPHEHHQGHEAQHQGAVHPHVVQQGRLRLHPLQAFDLKDGRLRNDVDLQGGGGGGRGGGGGGGGGGAKSLRFEWDYLNVLNVLLNDK